MSADADAAKGAEAGEGFERLDPKLVPVSAGIVGMIAVVASIPTVIAFASGGMSVIGALAVVATGALVLVALTGAAEYLRWRATRYRVTPDRFELWFHLVATKRRSLSRDRIRTVDITANPVQRLFGLAAVVIGTGQHSESGDADIKLDPVSRQRAEELRIKLLYRGAAEHTLTEDGPLAVLDWRWAAYAPLSFLTPALGTAAIGAVLNVSSWFGWDESDTASLLVDYLRTAAVSAVLLLAFGTVLAGAVGALLLFVEMWWGYRLDREPGGTLRVTRGLLTTRSLSLEERRLRGVEVVEPLGIRLVRAARLDAIATGVREGPHGKRADNKTVLPPAPRAVVDEVAAAVLREGTTPISAARLTVHPRAALTRRLRWALSPVVAGVALLAVPDVLVGTVIDGVIDDALGGMLSALPWIFAVIAAPVAIGLARDAYRNLGHGLSGGYLVARRGALRRSTVALQRSGVIGWTIRQSIFQRRAGVLTLSATTAAGRGAYPIPDVDAGEGLSFADEAVPGLLTPFLQPSPPSSLNA